MATEDIELYKALRRYIYIVRNKRNLADLRERLLKNQNYPSILSKAIYVFYNKRGFTKYKIGKERGKVFLFDEMENISLSNRRMSIEETIIKIGREPKTVRYLFDLTPYSPDGSLLSRQ